VEFWNAFDVQNSAFEVSSLAVDGGPIGEAVRRAIAAHLLVGVRDEAGDQEVHATLRAAAVSYFSLRNRWGYRPPFGQSDGAIQSYHLFLTGGLASYIKPCRVLEKLRNSFRLHAGLA
jgi:hypothetical protein